MPGLPAKDVIDVQVTVARAAGRPGAIAGLQARPLPRRSSAAGFAGDPAELAKRYFRARRRRRPRTCTSARRGRLNQRYALLCRDYLRADAGRRGGLRGGEARRWPAQFGDDRDTYADVKDPVVDVLMAGAEAWAAATGWEPGPSDA